MSRIKLEGPSLFRFNVIYSILSSKKIQINKIRHLDEVPGINDAEANFLRLMERVTNGSKFVINQTGTQIKLNPGFIEGGIRLVHECDCSRGIGYFLEPLLILLPFAHKRTEITLRGVTNHELDTSVDVIRTVFVPLLEKFGVEGLGVQMTRRGISEENKGEVKITCAPIQTLKPIDFTNVGKIKRIRGLCYTCKVTPTISNRVRSSARGLLNSCLPDVWIYTEHLGFKDGARNPGYGLSLVAESITGAFICVDHCAPRNVTPEHFGEIVAQTLCEEVFQGGFISTSLQPFIFTLMTLCPEDVSKVRTGALTEFSIEILRSLQNFFGCTFKLNETKNGESVSCSCLGIGYKNFIRQAS